jgi:hypothetical protein
MMRQQLQGIAAFVILLERAALTDEWKNSFVLHPCLGMDGQFVGQIYVDEH